jgi:hypothetical protein
LPNAKPAVKSLDGPPSPNSSFGLVRRIGQRVRHGGLSWLLARSAREIRAPQTAPGRILNALLRDMFAIRYAIERLSPSRQSSDDEALLAVYDTLVEPTTYDVLFFLLRAELERQRVGAGRIHVLFVGSANGETREEMAGYRAVVSETSQRDRIINMLIPAAWQLPTVAAVSLNHERAAVDRMVAKWPPNRLFPARFSTVLTRQTIMDCYGEVLRSANVQSDLAAFRATGSSHNYVRRWLVGHGIDGPFVAITLRTYGYNQARNSDLKAWQAAAHYLSDRGYTPVIVPDTESLADGMPDEFADLLCMPEAAWNVGLRLALYEQAFVNLGVSCGPLFLGLLDSKCRVLMFKIVTSGVSQNEEDYIRRQGFVIGGQIPFNTPFQKRVWRNDSFETIVEEFEAFEELVRSTEEQQFALR